MANNPMNAYGVARAIRQDYREAMTRFRNRTHTHVDQFTWVPTEHAVEAAYNILQPSIRVLREDCYAIPDATTERRLVGLGSDAEKAYKLLRKEAYIQLGGGKSITAVHEASLRNKLLQIAGGAAYTNNGSFAFDPGERAREVLNILEQTEDKIVILVPYRNQLELVKEFVTKAGYTCACIHGDVSAKDRGRLIDLYERTAHPRVLAADPRTLSHGVELSAAGTVIFYLPVDSNEVYRQACDRPVHRGQTKGVSIIQLCGTPEEAKIYDRLEKRQSLQGVLLECLSDASRQDRDR
jgi:SNF2 family DNA or RNA helicase